MSKSVASADRSRENNTPFELSIPEIDRLRTRVHELAEADQGFTKMIEALADELEASEPPSRVG